MFWRTCVAASVALATLGNFTLATAQESKEAGGKKQITNSIGMKLTLIPAGEFKMGGRNRRRPRRLFSIKGTATTIWWRRSSRTSIRSIACGSRSRFISAPTTSRGASSTGSSPTRGTRLTRRRVITRGPTVGIPIRRRSSSTGSIRGGTRVSSRPTSTRWST